jgi:Peptidase propeptide and YPEB domain
VLAERRRRGAKRHPPLDPGKVRMPSEVPMRTQGFRVGLALGSLLAFSGAGLASTAHCTIHPKKGASKAELKSLAKVSEEDARKTALASLKDPSKGTVKEAELESEHGCLVYSFDIQVAGANGIQEVQVDAGDGKVLSSEHESPKAEAAEKAKDKPTPKP